MNAMNENQNLSIPLIPKKMTKGRRKIEIKKVENDSNRHVTFSKRRLGLFKKASELCVICGAKIAVLVTSAKGKVFSFGYPDVEAVLNQYLSENPNFEDGGGGSDDPGSFEKHRRMYWKAAEKLEKEKKRGKEIEEESAKRGEIYEAWWERDVEGMQHEELEEFVTALEQMKMKLVARAKELIMAEMMENSAASASSSNDRQAATASATDGFGSLGPYTVHYNDKFKMASGFVETALTRPAFGTVLASASASFDNVMMVGNGYYGPAAAATTVAYGSGVGSSSYTYDEAMLHNYFNVTDACEKQ